MDEPLRVEESRLSKGSVFWLVALVVANLLGVLLLWPSSEPEVEASVADRDSGSLRLIDELSTQQRDAMMIREQPSISLPIPEPEIAEPEELVCRAWGPFNDITQLEPLQARVAAVGSAIEVRTSEIAGDPDYLVFIDTGGNADTARRMLQELESQSVDAYVIAGGPFLNAVSVGVFSRQARANIQHDRVESLGYDASIEALTRSQSVFHLIARVPQGFRSREPGSVACTEIASVP